MRAPRQASGSADVHADDQISISLVGDTQDPTVMIAGDGSALLRLSNLLIDLSTSSAPGLFLNSLPWIAVQVDIRVWIDCAGRDQGMIQVDGSDDRDFVWRISADHAIAFSAHLDELANSDCADPHYLEAGHDQCAVMVAKRQSENLRA